MSEDASRLSWMSRIDVKTGRVKNLSIQASCFPQERFLTNVAEIMQGSDSLLIKVVSKVGDKVRVATLGDEGLDIPGSDLDDRT